MEYKILIAEDDADIAELISLYLENENLQIVYTKDGQEAWEIFQKHKIDLLILDIMMPRMNGYEIIRRIREKSQVPILVLSAKTMSQDKVLGLGLGADMYMTKPFDPLELVANIKALARRSYHFSSLRNSSNQNLMKRGPFTFNPEKMCITKDDNEIPLTAFELKILVKMMKSPGRVFTKLQLYQVINQDYCLSDEDTIMVHISRIRSKIEEDPSSPRYIKTVRGLGYRFEYEDD